MLNSWARIRNYLLCSCMYVFYLHDYILLYLNSSYLVQVVKIHIHKDILIQNKNVFKKPPKYNNLIIKEIYTKPVKTNKHTKNKKIILTHLTSSSPYKKTFNSVSNRIYKN